MERDFVPTCEEKGKPKPIADDVNPGVCQINQKREDSQWGDWENPDTTTGENTIERFEFFEIFWVYSVPPPPPPPPQ